MEYKIKLSGITEDSIVDGEGIRLTVFTQGCPHHCKGCHNPQTHDFEAGYIETVENIVKRLQKNPLQRGITLSGGEPFFQARALAALCREVKKLGKDIWAYSGWTYEKLIGNVTEGSADLLSLCDVLVDGKFIEEEKDLTLTFRGSRNQRIIDVQKSLAQNQIVLYPVEDFQ